MSDIERPYRDLSNEEFFQKALDLIAEYAYNGHNQTNVTNGKHFNHYCTTCLEHYEEANRVMIEAERRGFHTDFIWDEVI